MVLRISKFKLQIPAGKASATGLFQTAQNEEMEEFPQ